MSLSRFPYVCIPHSQYHADTERKIPLNQLFDIIYLTIYAAWQQKLLFPYSGKIHDKGHVIYDPCVLTFQALFNMLAHAMRPLNIACQNKNGELKTGLVQAISQMLPHR